LNLGITALALPTNSVIVIFKDRLLRPLRQIGALLAELRALELINTGKDIKASEAFFESVL
jgi:hypothetical protein